jgi:hypothetical protein
MQDCGEAATGVEGMLSTSAVAIFFSCSGATEFSVDEVGFVSLGTPRYRQRNLEFQTAV